MAQLLRSTRAITAAHGRALERQNAGLRTAVRACCWPMWGNERPRYGEHRFCGDPTMKPGAAYCEKHARIAYPHLTG